MPRGGRLCLYARHGGGVGAGCRDDDGCLVRDDCLVDDGCPVRDDYRVGGGGGGCHHDDGYRVDGGCHVDDIFRGNDGLICGGYPADGGFHEHDLLVAPCGTRALQSEKHMGRSHVGRCYDAGRVQRFVFRVQEGGEFLGNNLMGSDRCDLQKRDLPCDKLLKDHILVEVCSKSYPWRRRMIFKSVVEDRTV